MPLFLLVQCMEYSETFLARTKKFWTTMKNQPNKSLKEIGTEDSERDIIVVKNFQHIYRETI